MFKLWLPLKIKKAVRDEARTRLSKQRKGRFRNYIRGYFLAGILVTAPIRNHFLYFVATYSLGGLKITPLIPTAYNPETYLPFAVPGLGLIIVFIALTFIGWSTAGLLGRLWTRVSEKALARMPVVRSVYAAVKQIIETILKQQSNAFREVVLFEYPRRGKLGDRFHNRPDSGRGPKLDGG